MRSDGVAVLRPHAGTFVIIVLLEAVAGLAGLVPLVAVAELGRVLLAAGEVDPQRVWLVVAVGAAGLAVRILAAAASAGLGHLLDTEVQLSVRRRLAQRLGEAPLGWIASRRTGELAKVVGDDVSAIHPLIAHTPGTVVSAIVVPTVSLVYLATIDWPLTLIALSPVAAALALLPLIMTPRRLREQADFDEGMGRLASAAVEFVQGIAEVKVFGGGGRAHRAFRLAVDTVVGSFETMLRGLAAPAAGMQLVLSPPVVLLVVLGGGIWRMQHAQLPAADLLVFLLLGLGLTAPVTALIGHGFEDVQAARRATGRISEVLATRPLPEPSHPQEPVGHRVVLDGVSFGYPGQDVLRGVDLTLEPGTLTALVGPSGSGKSTLVSLLPRFFDPEEGSISIGGVDLRDLDRRRLLSLVSFVLQDTVLLRASVAENIALAVPHADREDIVTAARLANVHERILQLPRGYQTVLGEEATLSGGEAQRLSLARALLADTPILVLDEATAFADPLTEQAIRETLTEVRTDKTLLVIAHRLETISDADDVAVLVDGRVVEHGTPERLLAKGGVFAQLWQAHQSVGARSTATPTTTEGTSR